MKNVFGILTLIAIIGMLCMVMIVLSFEIDDRDTQIIGQGKEIAMLKAERGALRLNIETTDKKYERLCDSLGNWVGVIDQWYENENLRIVRSD